MKNIMQRLEALCENDILRDIDLEVCRFLQKSEQDISPNVILAACLTSYLFSRGDVCLLLEKYAGQMIFDESNSKFAIKAPELDLWHKELSNSFVIGRPGDFKPFILDNSGRLYLHKLWYYEKILADQLLDKSSRQAANIDIDRLKDGLSSLFPEETEDINWQKVAAANAVRNKLSIISGGPGTGKTSTVVRVLALLLEQAQITGEELSIALTAPTGKAAGRLKDSILSAKEQLAVSEIIREDIPEQTMTLHQLLGARRHTSTFKHDANNPVPYKVVVVDEASMVDQALMSKLMVALPADTQLLLLGDKDQLASVEAGSVLGDICDAGQNYFSTKTAKWLHELSLPIRNSYISKNLRPLTDNITLLKKSYRFDPQGGIAQLAECINAGEAEKVLDVLKSGDYKKTNFYSITGRSDLEERLSEKITANFKDILESNSHEEALQTFNDFRILAAHRRGPWGVNHLNQLVESILWEEGFISKYDLWYSGKPIIIKVNDYTLGLHNGDTGICLRDEQGNFKVHFQHENDIRAIAPGRLPKHDMTYALTVHKSQGSEFESVLFILPNSMSPVLSRELFYTAVTRSRSSFSVLGGQKVIREAIQKKIQRSSGLKDHLWRHK